MNEVLIGFETASLLAKLNFNWDSNFYYDTDNNLQEFLYYQFERNCETYEGYPDDVILFVPTQSLLQKWLREKHQIIITISPTFTYSLITKIGYYYDVEIPNDDLYKMECKSTDTFFYSTYEEALEEGLKCALNLIK